MGKQQSKDEVRRYGKAVVYLLNGGLPFLIEKQGGEFLGFSIKGYEGDYLLVVRAIFNEKRFVSFAGGVTGCGCLVRWQKDMRKGEAKWAPDKYQEGK